MYPICMLIVVSKRIVTTLVSRLHTFLSGFNFHSGFISESQFGTLGWCEMLGVRKLSKSGFEVGEGFEVWQLTRNGLQKI